jgi:hypothetical protein
MATHTVWTLIFASMKGEGDRPEPITIKMVTDTAENAIAIARKHYKLPKDEWALEGVSKKEIPPFDGIACVALPEEKS